jgi:hypothetical protein
MLGSHGVDPQTYPTDMLTKLVNLWPAARIDDLVSVAQNVVRALEALKIDYELELHTDCQQGIYC